MWGEDPQGAQPAFAESVAAGQRFNDSDLLTMSRLGQGMCLVFQGQGAAGMALLDEGMVAVTSGEVSPMYAGIAYCTMIVGCSDLFDVPRARQWTAALTRWCDAQPDLVPFRGNCLVHRCELLQFTTVNFANIGAVRARTTGAGTIQLRWNAADAAPFATVAAPAGEGWQETIFHLSDPPQGTGTLVVTSSGGVNLDELYLADDKAPEVKLTLNPATPNGNSNWYRQPVSVTATATDADGAPTVEYTLNAGATWTPVNGPITVGAEGANALLVRAADRWGNAGEARQSISVDTKAPTLSWSQIQNGNVGLSVSLVPTYTDPTPGSGGAAIQRMKVDGKWVYPKAVNLWEIGPGVHTHAVTSSDVAGNNATTTATFVVSTSFADISALITRFTTSGVLTAGEATTLNTILAEAQKAADNGKITQARAKLALFALKVWLVTSSKETVERTALTKGAEDLGKRLTGWTPTAKTGVVVKPEEPILRVVVNPVADFDVPGAGYKVLVLARTPSFRHEHIVDTQTMIQNLGKANKFDVDVWDPNLGSGPGRQTPTGVSLTASPFTSLETLQQYDTVVFDSTVGRTNNEPLSTEEQAVFERYIQGGGGSVGIHAASDGFYNWPWYGEMLGGAWFNGHGGNQRGIQPDCMSCVWTETVNENKSNPIVKGMPATFSMLDELYNYKANPRGEVHTLLSITESSYSGGLGSSTVANPMGADHPHAWCSNYDGGRTFYIGFGHNWELSTGDDNYERWFQGMILGAI
ncbi:ThuA domain-containing protein [Phytohabitans rumicis]|uniref:ThuA domain-containing protein n=1 Tax=Phytohabitans rumicis TaxID=1076125 RepID=UPI0031EC9357